MSRRNPIATNFEDSYSIICEKVKEFDNNLPYFKRRDYLEDHVRHDFITPMFNALGWDVLHDIQKNPYKQEVKTEK